MWGYDVYSKYRFLPPLIDIDLFKPNTKKFIKNNPPERLPKRLLRKLYWIGRMPFDYFIRKNAISRINYFIPVLSIEYKLISKSYFRSKLFYKSGPGFRNSQQIYYSNTPGNILIGNSLSYTNNHLDIFELVKDMPIKGRKFIIPISYGEDYNKNIKKLQDISRLSVENTIWLKDFMPYEKYNDLMTTVTHAIMGHMRQQAIGNIFSCLRKGIKLYLFKDSITYNFLKEKGFIIFTIENDLSLSSLSEVLSEDDAIHNYNLLEEKDDRLEKYRERFIEIFNNNDIQRYC